MSACPACGQELQPIFQLYETEVRREDADQDRLGLLRPPTSRTAIQGFVLAVLVWMSSLVPFFVVNHFWRACLPLWILTIAWVPVFLKARKKDRRLRAAYEARRACGSCGWVQEA
jgi:hypothetical protein